MNRHLIIALIIVLFAFPLHAQWIADQATDEPNDVWSPALASSPDGVTVLAYATAGDPLLMDFVHVMSFNTQASDFLVWPDPVTLTSGSGVEVCWSRTGFHAAVNSGGAVVMYQADDYGNWDPASEQVMFADGYVTSIDLWGVSTDAAGPDVFMVVETWLDPPNGARNVQYAAHTGFGWSDFETVIVDPGIEPRPRITWSIGPAGPWPTVFYLSSTTGPSMLNYVTKDLASGWMTPSTVPDPCPVAGEFDVVTMGLLDRHVLGLGLQPTCPCGSIHHQQYEAGIGWLPQEHMTQDHAHYDWPMAPRLAAAPDGAVHAFWYQEASAHEFTVVRKGLEYQVWRDGAWTDESGFLDNYQPPGAPEARLVIAVEPADFPVLAWTKRDTVGGVPLPAQIWVARVFDTTGVEDGLPPQPLQLSASPNPFNPATTIRFAVPEAGPVELTIHDLSGRLVARLARGLHDAGVYEQRWNGCDLTGAGVASGTYVCRLVAGNMQTAETLVLLK